MVDVVYIKPIQPFKRTHLHDRPTQDYMKWIDYVYYEVETRFGSTIRIRDTDKERLNEDYQRLLKEFSDFEDYMNESGVVTLYARHVNKFFK